MHRKNMAADSAHRPVSVAIIGGGPAGSAAAVELCRRGHSVVILEHGFYESQRMGESVPPSARQIISELGLPVSLFAENSIPCEGIGGSWGSEEIYEKKFIFNPYGSGWHVDRQRLDLALAKAAEACGTELLLGAKLLSCNPTPEGEWQMAVETSLGIKRFQASFVIDASGRSSWMARKFGGNRVTYDRQIAIAQLFATGRQDQEPEPVTFIEATENGWWYSAPIPGGKVILVYLTDADLHRPGREQALSCWQDLLNRTRHIRYRSAGLSPSGRLHTSMADTYRVFCDSAQGNWINAGAAAAGLDPLCSGGICFALRSGRDAARAVSAWFSGDQGATGAYCQSLDEYFDDYLKKHADYYAGEMRWTTAPFWLRRQQYGPIVPSRLSPQSASRLY